MSYPHLGKAWRPMLLCYSTVSVHLRAIYCSGRARYRACLVILVLNLGTNNSNTDVLCKVFILILVLKTAWMSPLPLGTE
jgi:hypothetical protein